MSDQPMWDEFESSARLLPPAEENVERPSAGDKIERPSVEQAEQKAEPPSAGEPLSTEQKLDPPAAVEPLPSEPRVVPPVAVEALSAEQKPEPTVVEEVVEEKVDHPVVDAPSAEETEETFEGSFAVGLPVDEDVEPSSADDRPIPFDAPSAEAKIEAMSSAEESSAKENVEAFPAAKMDDGPIVVDFAPVEAKADPLSVVEPSSVEAKIDPLSPVEPSSIEAKTELPAEEKTEQPSLQEKHEPPAATEQLESQAAHQPVAEERAVQRLSAGYKVVAPAAGAKVRRPLTEEKVERPFRVKLRGSVLVLVRLPNKRSLRAAIHQLSTSGGVIHFEKPLDEKLVVELIFHIGKATIHGKAQLLFPMWATQGWMQPFRFVDLPESSRDTLDASLKSLLSGEAANSAAAGA